MGFNFAVNDGSSSATSTNDTEATPDFESNEVADLYLSFGDWKNTLGEMLEALDLEPLKVYSSDTLEDAGRLLEEHSEAHYQQKLHLLAVLAKSTAGKMQRDNDHSIGLQDGNAPFSHEEANGDFSYALFSKDLPTIHWEGLDGGERENLEEMGINPSAPGFDLDFDGPKLLKINGNRLPIAIEDPDDFNQAIKTLQSIPDEPSAYTEDGFRDSSDPSIFGDDDPAPSGRSASSRLAENPEDIGDFTVDEIKSAVTGITSRRTLQRLLEVEEGDKDRSITQRIEQRIRAVKDSDDSDESVSMEMNEGRLKSLYDMSDLEADAVMFRIESKGQSKEEAINAVRSL
jgi:hypothetical protein